MVQIKVATLNLRGHHDRWLERRSLVVAQLLDAAPDVVSLQEIYRPIRQGKWLRDQINSRLGDPDEARYRLVEKRKQHPLKGYFEGIGILSRLPILSHDAISLGYGGRVALRANLEVSWRDTVEFVAVHLHHAAQDREARVEQVMQLTGWLNEEGAARHQVIAGDFNELPTGPAVVQMKQTYRSVFQELRGYDPVATFPTALVARPDGWAGCLDYIFVSSAFEPVVDARLFCKTPAKDDPTLYPSDHVGLLATLELGPNP